jgi:four helix bundle protein
MSVPTNIVEGSGQRSGADFARFLRFSLNSTSELEYHLIAARDLRAHREQQAAPVIDQVIEVRRMLYGLLRYLESRPKV